MKISITKDFDFDSAHQLKWHKGKCKSLHGHTYFMSVTISGKINKNGVIMDYGDLKRIVNDTVVEKYDHQYLNSFFENPTAEIMTKFIFQTLKKKMPKNIKLEQVDLWETPTSKCTVIK